MITTPYSVFVSRLTPEDKPTPAGQGKILLRCPAHHDRNPSLLAGPRDYGANVGAASFTCLAGCDFTSIVRAFECNGKLDSNSPVRPLSVAEIQAREVEARQREEAQATEHLNAAKRIQSILAYCQPASPEHPYLRAKRIKPFTALQHKSGSLALPLKDFDGTVWSAQFISIDGRKSNAKGARRTKCFHQIPGGYYPIFVSEGFSTGCSVAEAMGSEVYCAMGLGNLEWLTTELVQKYGKDRIIIAADNDASDPDNPGLTTACAITERLGCIPVWPSGRDGEKLDWNDYHCRHGLLAVRESIDEQIQMYRCEKSAVTGRAAR